MVSLGASIDMRARHSCRIPARPSQTEHGCRTSTRHKSVHDAQASNDEQRVVRELVGQQGANSPCDRGANAPRRVVAQVLDLENVEPMPDQELRKRHLVIPTHVAFVDPRLPPDPVYEVRNGLRRSVW